ncbi:hypothetical protein B296_00038672, partial [Ensete ventricosum]
SFYSGCCGLLVPDDFTAFMTHYAVAPLAMPVVLVVRCAPAGGSCRPYLCQVGRTVPCCRASRHACRRRLSYQYCMIVCDKLARDSSPRSPLAMHGRFGMRAPPHPRAVASRGLPVGAS